MAMIISEPKFSPNGEAYTNQAVGLGISDTVLKSPVRRDNFYDAGVCNAKAANSDPEISGREPSCTKV